MLRKPPRLNLDARATAQLDAVVEIVRTVIGRDLIAAYLYGSAVEGGLRWRSDLDVMVVTRRSTTPSEKRQLIDGLLRISGSRATSGPARSIELTSVVQSEVRPWRYPPRIDLLYGDWMRAEFERGDPSPWPSPNPDLGVLLTMVLRAGVPLLGPPAAEVLDPVPFGDLCRAMLDGVPGLLDDLEPDTTNVILTLARIWTTVSTGEIRSKDAAADWAVQRLPETHRAVLVRARAIYVGAERDEWVDLVPRVRSHAEVVIRRIEAAAQRGLDEGTWPRGKDGW